MSEGAQTADRAIQLLLVVAESERPLGLSELSQRSGFNKAATYRLTQALTKHSLLARETDGGRYVIGSGLVALSARVLQKVNVREIARPAMERLAAATSETVSLYVRHFRHRICVAVVEGRHPVRWVVPLGDSQPLFVGLTGKVILAFQPAEEIAAIVEWAAEQGLDSARIASQLQRVRTQGYLAGVGDRMAGVGGLSAPVFDSSGVAAALTISGPGDRFTTKVAETMAELVLRECEGISAEIGHPAAASRSRTTRAN